MSEKNMQKERADEAQLVQQAQRGDVDAFTELFNRWNQPLLRYLYHTLGDGQEAEDLAQDAFLRAYQRLEQLGPPWDFKSWLYRIGTNLAMDHLERKRRYISVDSSDEAVEMEMPVDVQPPVERQVERLEQERQVWKSLGVLPTLYRQALILRELNGLSYEEIQVALDCTLENARQLVHRARLRFRDEYGFALVIAGGAPRCHVLGDLLSAYHDGQLSSGERRRVEEHLETCAECRGTREHMGAIGALLLGLPPFVPSQGWVEKVRGRVRAQAGQKPGNGARGGGGGGRFAGWPAVAGIGGLVIIGLVAAALWFGGRGGGGFGAVGAPGAPGGSTAVVSAPPNGAAAAGTLTPAIARASLTPELSPSASPTATSLPTETPTVTATIVPQVTFIQGANCRKGPAASGYYIVTSFAQGKQDGADGRNDSGTWVYVPVAGTAVHCWVAVTTLTLNVAVETLPVVPAPPLPAEPGAFSDHAVCKPKSKSLAVRLMWSAVSFETGYHLYRNGTLLETLTANATSYVDTSAQLGLDLLYEIEAFNANGTSGRAQTVVPACK